MYNITKYHRRLLTCIVTGLILLAGVSCKQVNVYEKNTSIPAYSWKKDFPVTGTFTITDTATPYKIYVVLRHTDAYDYNNIWLNIGLQGKGDTMQVRRFDLSLGDDANGWEGTGMNDIWEVRKLLGFQLMKKGEYKFEIRHIMRDDPLKNILSAGLRVEKAN
jgi:gliding motility-associated lipoprotein GldH